MTNLLKLIPPDELNKKLNQRCVEIDPTFLCFEDCYQAVFEYVPYDFTIVDLGCYMAAQSYLFTDYKAYVGIDTFDIWHDYRGNYSHNYLPPDRFRTENTLHGSISIESFMEHGLCKFDLDKTYFIMSAVPNIDADYLFRRVRHGIWWYPGQPFKTKGIYAEYIRKFAEELDNVSKRASV